MSATRCRNMAKLLAYHTLRDRAGCIDDARVADAVSDIAVGVLRSKGDPALDVAQVDYWAWTQAQETTR